MRAVLAIWLLLLPSPAAAEPATAQYAPVQLEIADAELERAEQAMRRGEIALAQRLAAQAALDARLSWAMTDSAHLRRAAALVLQRAMRLEEKWAGAGGG